MRNWKIIMMVLCLALCLPGLFGMAEAKGGKDMVKEKTAYVTRCSYVSSGSSTGGHEHIELTRLSDTEASYKISSKDWHSSPERVVEKKVSANVFKWKRKFPQTCSKKWKCWAGNIRFLSGKFFAKVNCLRWMLPPSVCLFPIKIRLTVQAGHLPCAPMTS